MRAIPFTAATARGIHALLTIRMPNQTLRVTTADHDVTIGSDTWSCLEAVNITQIQQGADGSPGNADIRIAATPGSPITHGMAARGLLDGLPVKVELFDVANPAAGTFDMIPGATIGMAKEDTNGAIILAVQGQLALMKAPMTEVHTIVCRARLGDNRCRVPLDVPDVARNKAYYLRDSRPNYDTGPWDTWVRKVESGSYHDRVYECTTAGTTASSAPTYPTSIGATVTDGTAVFTCRQAWMVAAVGQAIDFFNIQLASAPSVTPTTLGNIIPRTGPLKDTKIPIAFYDTGTRIVTTWEPFATTNFPPGTAFEIHPGCDRRLVTCRDVFANIKNMRAAPYAPNANQITGRS